MAVAICVNPECSVVLSYDVDEDPVDLLCCRECDGLRETTEADVCDMCSEWTDHAKYDDDYVYCEACFA